MWTEKLPTKPGWYWVQYIEDDYEPEPVSVYLSPAGLMVKDDENYVLGVTPVEEFDAYAWWSEPIPEPVQTRREQEDVGG